jgi:serine/threonine protein phosphatase 1
MVSLSPQFDLRRPGGRTIAVGDIHGCSAALRALLAQIGPSANDTIVTLGDYIDRGPDSRGVLDQLIALKSRCHLIALLGNHEQMLFAARVSPPMQRRWEEFGGDATLRSLGLAGAWALSFNDLAFLESCRLSFETATHLFVHANYDPASPLNNQDEEVVSSVSLNEHLPGPHVSGKIAIVGHTTQASGEILDLGYLKCLDTDCVGGGYLTALDVGSGQIWRAKETAAPLALESEALHLPLVAH